ncbi:MAG: PEP-CTERM sorting domain-containing protein, partial [Kiritimatiellae bacterium]|nr:PEP-CTERM sorting domain-containing protein [Kiritimatiellia bacterium]
INGYSGSDFGDASWTTGIKGNAYQFNGPLPATKSMMMMRDPNDGGPADGMLMSGDFTVECFFNTGNLTMLSGDAYNAGSTLVAMSQTVGNKFNYRLMLHKATDPSDVTLAAQYNDAAGTLHTEALGSVVSMGTTYYAALRWDGTDFSVSMQDMDDAVATLATSSSTGTGFAPNGAGTADDIFMLGATPISSMNPDVDGRYGGILDEVKISNAYLADGELLYNTIPEPASIAMIGVGALGLFLRRRFVS